MATTGVFPKWMEEYELPDVLALMLEQGMVSVESEDSHELPIFAFDSNSELQTVFGVFADHPDNSFNVNAFGPERFYLFVQDVDGNQVQQAFSDFCEILDALPKWWERWRTVSSVGLTDETGFSMPLNIDFPLLAKQKNTLIKCANAGLQNGLTKEEIGHIDGIVYVLDDIQDYAVNTLGLDESVVFPEGN